VALFSGADAVLLAPLPYAEGERLVAVQEAAGNGEPGRIGYLTFLDLRERSKQFAGLAAVGSASATLAGDGRDAERVSAMRVSAAYFDVMGLRTEAGRLFDASEDTPGPARRVAVLGQALWQRRFGGDPGVVGRPIEIGGAPFVVVGVLPELRDDLVAERTFGNAQIYFPLGYDPAADYACRTCRHLQLLGRLAPAATKASAKQELDGLFARLARDHPTQYDRPSATVVTLAEVWLGPVRPVLLALACGVGLLLLSACANVANLLLLRARDRAHEIAVRTALGVSRARLARQLLTEALLLALAGGVCGLLIAWCALVLVAEAGPAQIPRLAGATLDARAVAVGLGLVVLCALAFGLVPLVQLLRNDTAPALHGGRRTGDLVTWRARAWLVGANVVAAAVLLVGSGLLARSLQRLLAVETGFDPAGVLTAQLNLSGPAYRGDDEALNIAATLRFYDAVLERTRALPGVEAAAAVTTLPLGGGVDGFGLHVIDRPLANPEQAPSADRFVVTPGFFETLRIRLIRGRALAARDAQGAPAVAVVNRRIADEIFPGEDPLGRAIALGPPEAEPRTIVGVVDDVRHQGLDGPPGYQVYVPQAQWAWAETQLTLVLRAGTDPASLAEPLRRSVRQFDAGQPLTRVERYTDLVAATTGTRRFTTGLLASFALSALMLALVGLYGALGVVVSQRRREIGVRLALGARATQIRRMVLAQGLRPVVAGLAAGSALGALGAFALRSLLFGVEPLDPVTFAGSLVALLACATLACAAPAWRASATDPATTLRAE
jgi:predicted permease